MLDDEQVPYRIVGAYVLRFFLRVPAQVEPNRKRFSCQCRGCKDVISLRVGQRRENDGLGVGDELVDVSYQKLATMQRLSFFTLKTLFPKTAHEPDSTYCDSSWWCA